MWSKIITWVDVFYSQGERVDGPDAPDNRRIMNRILCLIWCDDHDDSAWKIPTKQINNSNLNDISVFNLRL